VTKDKSPPVEITAEQREALVKLAKFAIIPAMGFLATRQLYIHKKEVTAYIQYYKDRGFKLGLVRKDAERVSEYSGQLTPDDEVEIGISNMDGEDIKDATAIFDEAQSSGKLDE
jgi:hypothetical protein